MAKRLVKEMMMEIEKVKLMAKRWERRMRLDSVKDLR